MMSVRTRLVASTIIEFVIFVLIIAGIVISTGRSDRNDNQVRYSLRRLSEAQTAARNVGLEMDRADDLLASNGTRYGKVDYNGRVEDSFTIWETLLRENIKLSGNSNLGLRQKSELARVEALQKTYENIVLQVDEAVAASTAANYAQAVTVTTVAAGTYRTGFLPALETAIANEQADAASADVQSKSASSTSRTVPLVLAPVGLALVALISIILMRDVTKSITALKNGAQQLGDDDFDVVIDIGRNDEFKQVADAFNSMASGLKHSTEELRQYAHTVSHDLKGPLSTVMLASELLEEELLAKLQSTEYDTPLGELARLIKDNTGKAVNLVDELLRLAEAGQFPVDVEEVLVSEVVKQVVNGREIDLNNEGIAINVTSDLGSLMANPAQIYQLFANLVSNAIRYGECEKPEIDIVYLGKDESGAHRYRVRDNGRGIAPNNLDRLFEPFFKGEGGGTGIGLATVDKIVKLYGGEIAAYNDNGAVFEFTLKDWENQAW